jgi:uncharacterized protein
LAGGTGGLAPTGSASRQSWVIPQAGGRAIVDGYAFWTLAVLAAVLVGMGKGGMPVVGMLSVPVMALVMSPVVAAGLLLPVYVVSDMFGLYAYRREYDLRVLAILLPGAIFGILVGYLTAKVVSEDWVTVLVGVIGVVFALNLLLRHQVQAEPRRAEVAPGLFWGMLTGFTSFVSHSGGPPYQVYTLPLGMRKAIYAGTSTIAFAVINAVKLIPYYLLGQINLESLEKVLVLMPIAAVSVFFGVRLVKWLPERLFFQLVTWTLLLVSVKLVWDGAAHLIAA